MIKWQAVLLRMHSFPPHIERIHCLPRSSIASSKTVLKNSERIQISSMTHVIAAFFVLHIEEAPVARPLIMQIPISVEHIVHKTHKQFYPFDASVYFIFHY